MLAKEHKCLLVKIQLVRGYPDRILLTNDGLHALVEFKTVTGVLSAMQEIIFEQLREKKHIVKVIRTVEEFKELLTWMGS